MVFVVSLLEIRFEQIRSSLADVACIVQADDNVTRFNPPELVDTAVILADKVKTLHAQGKHAQNHKFANEAMGKKSDGLPIVLLCY